MSLDCSNGCDRKAMYCAGCLSEVTRKKENAESLSETLKEAIAIYMREMCSPEELEIITESETPDDVAIGLFCDKWKDQITRVER